VTFTIPAGAFGDRVRRRLQDESTIWFVSVGRDGTPAPNLVWFHWDGEATLVVYSRPDARRLVHLASHEQVALNLDSNGSGGDMIIVSGTAGPDPSVAPADRHEGFLAKYREAMTGVSGSPEAFAADYSEAIRVDLRKVRGH
jgi:PPOX class probable F420-dependent enzyme